MTLSKPAWFPVVAFLLLHIETASCETPLAARLLADRFEYPLYVVSDPADARRLFVVERKGRIQLVENGRRQAVPFLDITDRVVWEGGERGLFTLAFHPRYEHNGFFYVNYTDPDTVVSRFQVTADPDVADASSEFILIRIPQPHENHNGGCIQFGPADGMLYIGMGDGGGPSNRFNAQDPSTLLGKMLRLDVDAPPPHIPADNPYVGEGDPPDVVWAFGLRNPWRFSFDRQSADLYIADVGAHLREEISIQPASSRGGDNYGWPCFEGQIWTGDCQAIPPGNVLPIWTYPTSEGCAIIGGYVYRGQSIPDLRGTYWYADLCNHRIFSFRYSEAGVSDFRDRTGELTPNSGTLDRIVSFGEDADGELYIVSRMDNAIFRITPDFRKTHGDVTDDCHLDLRDFAYFQNCFSGSGPHDPDDACDPDAFDFIDIDADGDVDFDDYSSWAAKITGPSECFRGCISATCH